MLKKFLREFREILDNLPHCQMQATAVIWAEPIGGSTEIGGGGEAPNLGLNCLPPLHHAGYGPEYITLYFTKP